MNRSLVPAAAFCLLSTALAIPLKPTAIISPDPSLIVRACDEGYASGSDSDRNLAGFSKYVARLAGSLDDGYVVQLAQGSVFSLCSTKAQGLEAKPDARKMTVPLLVRVAGHAPDLAETEKWAAALSFLDASGKEIARFAATAQQEGKAANWKVNCSGGSCTWSGANNYFFDFSKMPSTEKQKALKATQVAVLINGGNGIEKFILDSEQLNQL